MEDLRPKNKYGPLQEAGSFGADELESLHSEHPIDDRSIKGTLYRRPEMAVALCADIKTRTPVRLPRNMVNHIRQTPILLLLIRHYVCQEFAKTAKHMIVAHRPRHLHSLC